LTDAGSNLRVAWDGGAVVLRGSDLPGTLAVVPVEALRLGDELVPTAGSWQRTTDVACFTPRFPPVDGTVYAVIMRGDAGSWREHARVAVPRAAAIRTAVVQSIDPGGESVPANLLRFSVTFSATMEEGSAGGHIHLRDANGKDIPGSLFSLTPEFWDRQRRRLTVLLEPGRVKRGLRPNLLAGAPLVDGSTVTLVVDPGLRDSSGTELAEGNHRTYRVGPAVRTRVDPARWEVTWPNLGHDQLVVRFDRPLDRALVRRCLSLVDERGHLVAGRPTLDLKASVWTFTPASPGGNWRLQIDTRLEDLAGNSVRRVFDRDLQRADGDDRVDASSLVLDPDGRVERR
jgi:hypothetical protein